MVEPSKAMFTATIRIFIGKNFFLVKTKYYIAKFCFHEFSFEMIKSAFFDNFPIISVNLDG